MLIVHSAKVPEPPIVSTVIVKVAVVTDAAPGIPTVISVVLL
jgi:hypothetical protein